ncbi:modification methylase NgoPII [Roseibium sp. TrichSKD4]|uniref:DNA cytosine methyltransferase n=1 Tax=Roseibium sp. TrichSKD4 TaxID=744980 RepID=UPI0001E5654C|nr:DNA cytosine methyltransferase [Roseibium sp. TrichSKD4]EFO34075.1 modification methylase NgoPII [Roseibium sp. TrichSKD4]
MKAISLFSGCGGMDLGFENAGISILAAYDSDSYAVSSYNRNVKLCARRIDVNRLDSIPSNFDILIATPPCQGFSTAGGYRVNDPRNNLLINTCEIIKKESPKLAIIENVASIINIRNSPLLNIGLDILRGSGYHVEIKIISCDNFGVPQRRKRAFIFARSDRRYFRTDILSGASSKVILKDVFNDLPMQDYSHKPRVFASGTRHHKIAESIKPGQKLCNVRASALSVPTWHIPEVFGHTTKQERQILELIRTLRRRNRKRNFGDADPVSIEEINSECTVNVDEVLRRLLQKGYLRQINDLYDLTNTFNGKYRRLSLLESSPTVDTRFGDHQLFLHPKEHRGMTVREAARIQGFPDYFTFSETPKICYRLIGNAVPPPVAQKVAAFARYLV